MRRKPSHVLSLTAPLAALKGLGPKRCELLRAAGLATVGDLLRWPPRRHATFPPATPIAEVASLPIGAIACIRAKIRRRKGSGRRGIVATRFDVADASGELTAILFGPSWLVHSFKTGETALLRGEWREHGSARQLVVRDFLHEEELPAANATTLQPHYELPNGLAPRLHRRVLRAALDALRADLETIQPAWSVHLFATPKSLAELLRQLHFPASEEEARAARKAFALEEAIAIQRRLAALRQARKLRPSGAWRAASAWRDEYVGQLPFAVTSDQARALDEIVADLASPHAMSRLLTGDVGAGKSAVAFFPLVAAARAGRQAALLAPTEILAQQHVQTLAPLLERLQIPAAELITRGSGRREFVAAPIVVGTHRLFSAPVRFRDLAAVVVDEQHKFGVRQRSRLFAKGERPDLLLVSATPIPRTLALTLFGHLDLSVLTQRPAFGRDVRTELLIGEARRDLALRIKAEVERGGKVFVVCPAIGNNDDAMNSRGRVAAAATFAPWLRARLGNDTAIEVLHGRLDAPIKQQRLQAFAAGNVKVLVATVVVEVGIDVPDATLAVVLGGERFGLSQLHQLRGRIGRRGEPATCLVVAADPSETTRARLDAFVRNDDGFALAELDLKLRGPGELLGARQHGVLSGLYPEALLDPALVSAAKELASAAARPARDAVPPCKPVAGKRFRERAVADSEWIW